MHWWTLIHKDGKKFILGPFENDVSARERAEKMSPHYSLHELPTRDENKATRMIKARSLNTENVSHRGQ